ncbi:hypothetical protein Agau_P200546 (plasmid) [Agrobacterium tumefaciens F2]|nr:hypothetical protein Agau_P200546 [Agrobacterium tumefaciens F2]
MRSGCRWRSVGGKGSFAAGGATLHLVIRALASSALRGRRKEIR